MLINYATKMVFMPWRWLEGVTTHTVDVQCIDYRHETIYCYSLSLSVSSLVFVFALRFLPSVSLSSPTTICDIRNIPCMFESVPSLFDSSFSYLNAKIEMTYFIYNWNFQSMYAHMRKWCRQRDSERVSALTTDCDQFVLLAVCMYLSRVKVEGVLYPIKGCYHCYSCFCYCFSYK